MARIISIANHKGGVGKTTSTQNIGAALSKYGNRVLLVDLDPQANLSDAFGFDRESHSIYNALTDKGSLPILHISENLDLVPSNIDLSVAEIELSGITGREYILRDVLEKVAPQYDYILIDCPPSLGVLTINALTASTEVYIPIDSQYFSVKGLDKLKIILHQIQQRLNKVVEISGVFLTLFDSRIIVNRNMAEMLEAYFPNKLLQTKIRRNVSLVEAPIQDQDIFTYAPDSHGAEDYYNLAREIMEMHDKDLICEKEYE